MNRGHRRIGLLTGILAAALMAGQPAKAADGPAALDVAVDQATVVKLPDAVGTVVVGNPLIADVSIQSGGMMVVTGKGYGSTNLMALDRSGKVLMERAINVSGPRGNTIVVYRGVQRETYSCEPNCERRITLGDGPDFFNAAIGQTSVRNTQAQSQLQQAR